MTHRRDKLEQLSESPEDIWLNAKKQFAHVLHRLQQLPVPSRAKLQSAFAQQIVEQTITVDTPAGPLAFVLLGKTSGGRATSVLTKQPGTIEWIDAFAPDSVFWDIGANVGVYTLYAARRGTRVVACEPAAVNYFLLSANCEANNLNNRVDCLLLGIGSGRGVTRFDVSQFDSGGSFKRGEPDGSLARQSALVLSIDELVEDFGLPCPHYIKIDVPGMTEDIIDGAARTLRRPEVRELHIELRAESKTGQRIVAALDTAGFAGTSRHQHGRSADVTFVRSA